MMIPLSSLDAYIKNLKVSSVSELCTHFKVKSAVMRHMLKKLEMKQVVILTNATSRCMKTCSQCPVDSILMVHYHSEKAEEHCLLE